MGGNKKTILSSNSIVRIKKLSDGTFEVSQWADGIFDFILIEAEKLSMDDEFMKYEPKTINERETKKLVYEAIFNKVKNFYISSFRPSHDIYSKGICFWDKGGFPPTNKSYKWWSNAALEYGAFLGVLIKSLMMEGKSVEWTWDAVCNDPLKLLEYWKARFGVESSRLYSGLVSFDTWKVLNDGENFDVVFEK